MICIIKPLMFACGVYCKTCNVWLPFTSFSQGEKNAKLKRNTLCCNGNFPCGSRWIWVSWYKNVSILDFAGAKGDGGGGGNWSYK